MKSLNLRLRGGPAPAREWDALDRLTNAVRVAHRGDITLVSSFGAESVVLLHLISLFDKTAPILFIDTQMLFQETLDYQVEVAGKLGLTNVQVIRASEQAIAKGDPDGTLHKFSTDACCDLRKVQPMEDALKDYDA